MGCLPLVLLALPLATLPAEDDAHTAKDPVVQTVDAFIEGEGRPPETKNWKQQLKRPPVATFDPASEYLWHIETSKGELTLRFMPEVAPIHVTSTIYLARTGFYDGLKFHRVIDGFMAQGGCPRGNGKGGPGYTYKGECDPKVRHDRPGLLSMANTGKPRSDGSQFFLTFTPQPGLDGKHTIFGEVLGEEGMKTLRALEACGSESGKPTEPLKIQRTWISVRPKAQASKEEQGERGG
jgi:cyclophilin family peptidyl-prolyl cis-trans isomerase